MYPGLKILYNQISYKKHQIEEILNSTKQKIEQRENEFIHHPAGDCGSNNQG